MPQFSPSSLDGAAIPAGSIPIGASDGVNLQTLLAQTAANPNLKVVLFNGGVLLIGQKTMANSLPIAIASDQSNLPVASTNNGVVAAAAGAATVIKASPGNLITVTITTPGTVATNIFDNASAASGTVLLALPATTTLGQTFNINGRALNGITAAGSGAGAPGYTVYFS